MNLWDWTNTQTGNIITDNIVMIYKGYMYAPNYRTAYGIGTMEKICDVNKLTGIALWGPSHEIGHINQIRPGANGME